MPIDDTPIPSLDAVKEAAYAKYQEALRAAAREYFHTVGLAVEEQEQRNAVSPMP